MLLKLFKYVTIIGVCFLINSVLTIDPDYSIVNRMDLIARATINTLMDLFELDRAPINELVTFWCANPSQPVLKQVTIDDPDIRSKINFNIPISFLIHGWTDNVTRSWVNRTIDAYITNVNGNMCGVDWNRLATTEYTIAANNNILVANYLTKFIKYLLTCGTAYDRLTLIGHSMGAQIAGMTGAQLNGQINQIIGLDPAGWSFTKPSLMPIDYRLDQSDAVFVQCIHTDDNYLGFGTSMPCGHVDYYPNEGLSPQPGCNTPELESGLTLLQITCSHFKAVQYFEYSLYRQYRFVGTECPGGYTAWESGNCNSYAQDVFGIYSRQTAAGKLYLKTTINPPFAVQS